MIDGGMSLCQWLKQLQIGIGESCLETAVWITFKSPLLQAHSAIQVLSSEAFTAL